MITCPWCGTSYEKFQSNCSNCGGPLPSEMRRMPAGQDAASVNDPGPTPPSPPRSISDRYAWRLMWGSGQSVVALVFGILGSVFTLVGAALTAGIITAFVGLPFLVLGLVFLLAGGVLGYLSYQKARRIVGVLRAGIAAEGKIVGVTENLNVRVNQRHPWTIRYQFQVTGREYEGQVSTLNAPGVDLQIGRRAWVLYLPQSPEDNALYPHP